MKVKRVRGLPALKREIQQLGRAIERRSIQGARGAARDGVRIARRNAPVAFKELQDGMRAASRPRGGATVSTAPHAAPAEVGSRPHRPPLAPILAWVRLRGMQGLGRRPGGAASFVAGAIRELGTSTSTPADAAEQVAWAIVGKIAKEGTKPTFYMARSLPDVVKALDARVKSLLAEAA